MQLAALGLFAFQLATFLPDELERETEWDHARAERVGARAASQYVGVGAETVRIAGAIMPEAAGSYSAIATLKKMADEGEAWSFVLGNGQVWGNFVIVRLSERLQYLTVDGTPRRVDFTIELERRD